MHDIQGYCFGRENIKSSHVSIDTTNVYAQIDLDMKTKALRHCEIFDKTSRKSWKGKHGVLQFLRSL